MFYQTKATTSIKQYFRPEEVYVQATNSCLPTCNGTGTAEEYEFVDNWLTGWSTACFICSLFAVCTFALDQSRFKYVTKLNFLMFFVSISELKVFFESYFI